MKLLIITQKVNQEDSVLGFFHSWIREFASRFEKVTVICLEKGAYDLPKNVEVFSLGKEEYKIQNTRYQIDKKIFFTLRFLWLVWKMRKDYNIVFVHMNPEYVVLGGSLWRVLGKRIGLWYVHRQTNLKLRIAEKLAHVIFSTTPEAFRLESNKIHFLGHGIDFSLFPRKGNIMEEDGVFQIVHVGRITPIKNLDILIEAGTILNKTLNGNFRILLAGAPSTVSDIAYEAKLKELVRKHNLQDKVLFLGEVPFGRIGKLYKDAHVSVNLTPTGGMDKAVLESIASGTLALSANRAFQNLFGEDAGYLSYNERDPEDIARKIKVINEMGAIQRMEIEARLHEKVKEHFSLQKLIEQITLLLKQ